MTPLEIYFLKTGPMSQRTNAHIVIVVISSGVKQSPGAKQDPDMPNVWERRKEYKWIQVAQANWPAPVQSFGEA